MLFIGILVYLNQIANMTLFWLAIIYGLSVLQNMTLQGAEQVFLSGPLYQQRGENVIFIQCHKIFPANQCY